MHMKKNEIKFFYAISKHHVLEKKNVIQENV